MSPGVNEHSVRSLPRVMLPSEVTGAASPLPYPAGQVALTIPLRDVHELVVAVVAANAPLSIAKARRAFRAPALRRATLAETRHALPGVEPTAIPPFAALLGLRAVVDRRLLTHEHVVCAAGTAGDRRLVPTRALLRFGRASAADVCRT